MQESLKGVDAFFLTEVGVVGRGGDIDFDRGGMDGEGSGEDDGLGGLKWP